MNRRFTQLTKHMDTAPKRTPAPTTPTPATGVGPTQGQPPELRPEQELDYRLKGAIDQRGRYSFRLDDMAAGFAAGRNVTHAEARKSIEDSFTRQFGQRPQDYLDQHYDQRREMAREASRNPAPEPGRDYGRER